MVEKHDGTLVGLIEANWITCSVASDFEIAVESGVKSVALRNRFETSLTKRVEMQERSCASRKPCIGQKRLAFGQKLKTIENGPFNRQ